MKVQITPARNSGLDVEEFKTALIEWVEEWADEDEEIDVEVTLLGESHDG